MEQDENGCRDPTQSCTWSDILAAWTLRFHDEHLNAAFYEQQVTSSWVMQDRALALLSALIVLRISLRMDRWGWAMLTINACWLTIWLLWAYLAAMRTPTARRLYLRYRTPLLLAFRLGALIGGHAAYQRSHTLGHATGTGALLIHLLLTSRTAMLFILSLGGILPFWLHLLLQPLSLAAVLGLGTLHTVSQALCRCCGSQVARLHAWLGWAAALSQPTQHLLMVSSAQVLQVLHDPAAVQAVRGSNTSLGHAASGASVSRQYNVQAVRDLQGHGVPGSAWAGLHGSQAAVDPVRLALGVVPGPPQPTCPACPARVAVLFCQLTLGVLLPTVLLYRMEWAGRTQFAARRCARGGCAHCSRHVQHSRLSMPPLLLEVGRLLGALPAVWQLLTLLLE